MLVDGKEVETPDPPTDGGVATAGAEAPPGDDVLDLDEPVPSDAYPEVGGVTLNADFSNLEEWRAAADAAAMAEAEQFRAEMEAEEAAGAGETPPPSTTAGQASPAAVAHPSEPVPSGPVTVSQAGQGLTAEQIEAYRAAGYTIEPPAPPPDPMVEIMQRLEPRIGQRVYDEQIAILASPLPPEPDAYDMRDNPDSPSVKAYTDAKAAHDAARATIVRMNEARALTNDVVPYIRERTLREHGTDIDALPTKFPGINTEVVAKPQSLGALFDAVADAVTRSLNAKHQQEMAEAERRWSGRVSLAQAGAQVDRTTRIGRATPAANGGASSGTVDPMSAIPMVTDPTTGIEVPDPKYIEAALQGRLQ